MGASDTPIPPAEIERTRATVKTAELCDRQAGITNAATVNARKAVEAAAKKAGKR